MAGRPTKFREGYMDKIKKMALAGFTDAEMADLLSVTEQTFNNWKRQHPEFFESLKDWKMAADAEVERSLYERARGYSHAEDKVFNANGEPLIVPTIKRYPPDTAAAFIWLKNRRPQEWRDQQTINFSVPDEKKSDSTSIEERIKSLLSGKK